MAATFRVVLLFCTLGIFPGIFTQVLEMADFATPAPEPAPDSHNGQRFSGDMTGEGICQCAVQLPTEIVCTDYQAKQNLEELRSIQQQIAVLTRDIDNLYETTARHAELFAAFESNLTEVTTTFDLIEGGQVIVTRVEIEGVLTRIRYMESTLYALRKWHGIESDEAHMGQIQVILDEASNITRIVDAMASQDVTDSSAALQRQVSSLADQLKSCTGRASVGTVAGTARQSSGEESTGAPLSGPPAGADELSSLPELWPAKKKQKTCGRLVGVSEPYTVRYSQDVNSGTWMRDPIQNPNAMYTLGFSSADFSFSYSLPRPQYPFRTSAFITSFQRDEMRSIELYTSDHIADAIVFNGSIYAHSRSDPRYGGEMLKEINLETTYTVLEQQLPIAARRGESSESLMPPLDLTLDETGLWLLYANSLGMLTVSQVDLGTLEFAQTLQGAYPKKHETNCFVVCAKVYCLNSYTEYDAKVSYFMDTETGFEGFTKVPFIIKYGNLSSIEYNPRDQMLYGWDNGHAVVYSLTFD